MGDNERQRIRETLTEEAVVATVADDPLLLAKVLERAKTSALSGTESQRRAIARKLTESARDITPDPPNVATSDPFRIQDRIRQRSDAAESVRW